MRQPRLFLARFQARFYGIVVLAAIQDELCANAAFSASVFLTFFEPPNPRLGRR